MTNRVSEMGGVVTDRQGRPSPGVTVICFAEDDGRWAYPSRFTRAEMDDASGRYRLKDLLPGDYLAVAVSDIAWGAWSDPAVLESLRPYATRVTLGDGAAQTLNLTLAAWRQ